MGQTMTPETLGILVTTGNHPEYIVKLTTAAVEKGKAVRLLFSGNGIALLATPEIQSLEKIAEIRIHQGEERQRAPIGKEFRAKTPAAETDIIFNGCERFVVF
jgi:hypothetical protein